MQRRTAGTANGRKRTTPLTHSSTAPRNLSGTSERRSVKRIGQRRKLLSAELRAALASEDPGLIKSKMEALQRAAYALAEEVYKDAAARAAKTEARGDTSDNAEKAGMRPRKGTGGREDGPKKGAEDVDYEVVE